MTAHSRSLIPEHSKRSTSNRREARHEPIRLGQACRDPHSGTGGTRRRESHGSENCFQTPNRSTRTPFPLAQRASNDFPMRSNDEVSPRLSAKTRLFLFGNTVSMFGTGMVLPWMIIYFHEARGLALPVVGLLMAAGAATGLVVGLACGALMDRVGARPVLSMILLGQVVDAVSLAWAHDTLT